MQPRLENISSTFGANWLIGIDGAMFMSFSCTVDVKGGQPKSVWMYCIAKISQNSLK